MKYAWFLATLFVFQFALAQEADVLFNQATQLYRNGEYQQAAQMYEQVVKNGYESAALRYNLGNAYFKTKNIPAAIVEFERAKRLAPHDEDIAYNLRLANLRVVDKIEPIPQLFFVEWWRSLINMCSSETWATLAIVFLWSAVLLTSLILLTRAITLQRIGFAGALLMLFLSIFSFVGTFQRLQREQNEQDAVVFAQSVSVKSAPDPQSTDLFVLHEGVKVEFLDAVGEWRKIRLADGKVGWLMIGATQVI